MAIQEVTLSYHSTMQNAKFLFVLAKIVVVVVYIDATNKHTINMPGVFSSLFAFTEWKNYAVHRQVYLVKQTRTEKNIVGRVLHR